MAEAAERALREVEDLVDAGMEREAAIELMTGDDAFARWLEDFRKEMNTALK